MSRPPAAALDAPPPAPRATLKDVAAASGCAFQTVSAILGSRAHLFRPELRERVVAAAERLGYRPNGTARSMRSGITGCVAVLRGTDPHHSTLSEPMLDGIVQGLARHDLHAAILRLDDERLTDRESLPRILREWSADGLLIKYDTRVPAPIEDLLRRHRIPAVWINSRRDVDAVRPDDLDAGRRATEHLIALGHRRIAYADFAYDRDDPGAHYSARDRAAGYRAAMGAAGLAPRLIGGRRVASNDRLAPATAALAGRDRPTAIVASSAWTAYPLWHAALRRRLVVPDDLSLVSFETRTQDELGLELTQLLVPDEAIGRAAAELLVQKLRDPAAAFATRVIPCQLLAGATCAPPAPPRSA